MDMGTEPIKMDPYLKSFPLLLIYWALTLSGCAQNQGSGTVQDKPGGEKRDTNEKAVQMVEEQIIERGITDKRVIDAMKQVPRHRFVAPEYREKAYQDHPLPIGEGQTISQPYVVAHMTELLDLSPSDTVLEIGTGSGYQAAILGSIAEQVHSVEIREELAKDAERTLKELGYENVHVHIGDGYQGWPSEAPYDGIIVTAAPEKVPEALKEQLAVGGRLVIPVGDTFQRLKLYIKEEDGTFKEKSVSSVQFVPMVKDTNRQR